MVKLKMDELDLVWTCERCEADVAYDDLYVCDMCGALLCRRCAQVGRHVLGACGGGVQ